MAHSSLVPKPWYQVGLAILPGCVVLLAVTFSAWFSSAVPRFLALAVILLPVVSSHVLVARRQSLFQMPVWSLIPWGFLVGFFGTWGLFMIAGTLDFYWICFLLLVVTGLLFARQGGLSAGLYVLSGGIIVASWYMEPGLYLGSSAFVRVLTGEGMVVLFMILAPILVLRSRSIVGQAVGLLFPILAYSAAYVYALSSASGLTHPYFQFSISQSMSVARPFIILIPTIILASATYIWVSSQHSRADRMCQ